LYPNPSKGNLTLIQSVFENYPIEAMIVDGRGRCNFNMSDTVPGVYLLKLKDENGNPFNLKFVIE
jgi:hypothetical protein